MYVNNIKQNTTAAQILIMRKKKPFRKTKIERRETSIDNNGEKQRGKKAGTCRRHVVWHSAFTPRSPKIILGKKNRTGGPASRTQKTYTRADFTELGFLVATE